MPSGDKSKSDDSKRPPRTARATPVIVAPPSSEKSAWRIRYEADPEFRERHLAKQRKWNAENVERKRAYGRESMLKNRARRDAYMMQWKHGITSAQYEELLEAQGGLCLLCQKPPTIERLVIDHDHKTGIIRALLHRRCNGVLAGVFGDDPLALRAAMLRFGEMAGHVTTITGKRRYGRIA